MSGSVKEVLIDYMARLGKERLIQRLSRHLVKRGQCWIWTANESTSGYPRMNFRYRGVHRSVFVHHIFFVLREGRDITEGMELDHKCVVAMCVWCTQEVTHKRNMQLQHVRKKERHQAAR